jgi:hypothetical protein
VKIGHAEQCRGDKAANLSQSPGFGVADRCRLGDTPCAIDPSPRD